MEYCSMIFIQMCGPTSLHVKNKLCPREYSLNGERLCQTFNNKTFCITFIALLHAVHSNAIFSFRIFLWLVYLVSKIGFYLFWIYFAALPSTILASIEPVSQSVCQTHVCWIETINTQYLTHNPCERKHDINNEKN